MAKQPTKSDNVDKAKANMATTPAKSEPKQETAKTTEQVKDKEVVPAAVKEDLQAKEQEVGANADEAKTAKAQHKHELPSMQLTPNFNLREFHSKDGKEVPTQYYANLKVLAKNLQALRDRLGKPVIISGSGYRSPEHNKAVGGAPKSQHLTASAADITVKGMTPVQLGAKIEQLIAEGIMQQGGLGVYKTFVHYDIRKGKARWNG